MYLDFIYIKFKNRQKLAYINRKRLDWGLGEMRERLDYQKARGGVVFQVMEMFYISISTVAKECVYVH